MSEWQFTSKSVQFFKGLGHKGDVMEAGSIAKVGHYYYQSPNTPGIIEWLWDDKYGWTPAKLAQSHPWERIPSPTPEQKEKAVALWPPNQPMTVISKPSP